MLSLSRPLSKEKSAYVTNRVGTYVRDHVSYILKSRTAKWFHLREKRSCESVNFYDFSVCFWMIPEIKTE